jgi:hypothetical protein
MTGSNFTFKCPPRIRQWLEAESKERGIPKTTVVQLLLEQAMRGTNAKP